MSAEIMRTLEEAAHDAPLAKVYEDHRGHRFIGVHTDAWWKASRALFRALEEKGGER